MKEAKKVLSGIFNILMENNDQYWAPYWSTKCSSKMKQSGWGYNSVAQCPPGRHASSWVLFPVQKTKQKR